MAFKYTSRRDAASWFNAGTVDATCQSSIEIEPDVANLISRKTMLRPGELEREIVVSNLGGG